MLKQFDNEGITYVHKIDPDYPDRLLGIIFTFPWCEGMWKRHGKVLSINNTYGTNKNRFPLLIVTTTSRLNTVLNLAFGLINDKKRESFDFLIDGLNQIQAKINTPVPQIVITDQDDQLREALKVNIVNFLHA